MPYRTTSINPDYRRDPKTNCYCEVCQKDIKAESQVLWIAFELDRLPEIIHPADLATAWIEIRARRAPHLFDDCIQFGRVGPECAKKIGLEWTMSDKVVAKPD